MCFHKFAKSNDVLLYINRIHHIENNNTSNILTYVAEVNLNLLRITPAGLTGFIDEKDWDD